MAEGEEHENKDDLFEDLDKFFAPIQDVDWPEPGEAEEKSQEEETRAAESATEHVEVLPEGWSQDIAEIPDISGEAHEEATHAQEEVAPAPPPAHVDESAITEEALRMPPAEYAHLPGPEEPAPVTPEGPEAAEMGAPAAEELTTRYEPEPSAEAVEAAADHFAEAMHVDDIFGPGGEERPEPQPEETPAAPADVEQDILAGLEQQAPRTVKVGATEGLGGPTWQEPTSSEVEAEPERVAPEKNLPAALLTGLILAALAVGTLAIGAGPFAVFVGAAVLLAQGELYAAMHKARSQPATALGLLAGALVLVGAYFKGEPAMLAMVALALAFTFLWYLGVPAAHRRNTLLNVALTMVGIVWGPLFAGYILVMLRAGSAGRSLVVATLGLAFLYDTAAFVGGYFWGGRPLARHVSPSKSWEGAIVGALVTIAISVALVAGYVDPFKDHVVRAFLFAVVIAIAAQFGDLAESLIKRDLGLKDMSSVLPGHGGLLDRIDSALFAAPAAFLFLRIIL